MSAGSQRENASATARPEIAPPKRRRARRWTRAFLILFALILALRVALAIGLPIALDRWAKPLGLSCTYERLDLSLLRGRIDLWHLVLEPRREAEAASTQAHGPEPSAKQGTAEELAHLEYATVDVDLGALLGFAFRLDRLEIDGLEIHAVRESDGRLNIARYLTSGSSDQPVQSGPVAKAPTANAKPSGAQAPEPAAPLHLTPPIAIGAVRLQRVRVHYEDAHVSPPIDARLDLDVSASDIGSKVRPLRAEITALSPENLGSLFIEVHCTGDDLTLHGDFGMALELSRPQAFRGYLETIGISPHAKQISFKMRGDVDVAVQGERKNEARATLALRDLRLSDDLDEALALDALTCRVDSISTQHAHVGQIEISGVRAAAARLSSGAVRFAGIDLSLGDSTAAAAPASNPPGSASEAPSTAAYPFQLDQLRLTKSSIRFRDAAVEPHADVALDLDELEIDHVATDPALATVPISVRALLHAPRVAANAKLDGEIACFSRRKSLSLALSADHITLEAIAPYLRAAKLAPDLTSGTLTCKISGTAEEDASGATRGRVQLDGFALSDAAEVCAIDRIAVEDVVIDPARALVRIGSVEIAGTRGGFDRDPELSVHWLGLRTLPAPELAATPASASTTTPKPPPANGHGSVHNAVSTAATVASVPGQPSASPASAGQASSRFELGKLVWHKASLHYRDRALEPELALTFADAKVEAQDLVFGGAVGDPARPPAKIHMLLHAPGIAEKLECTATIESRPGPIDLALDLALNGQGLRAGEISPYLLDQGIDSKLDGADLSFAIKSHVKAEAGGVAVGLAFENFELRNAGQSIASLDALRLRDAHLLTDVIRIGEVSLENPRATVSRDATGALILGGVRFVAPTPPRPGHRTPPSILDPLVQSVTDLVVAELADKNVIVDRVRTSGVDVHWSDASVSPPVDVHALLGLKVDRFVMGKAAAPATLALEVAVPGALGKMGLAGTISLAPKDWSADLAFDAQGLDAGPLAPYLPPGLAADLHAGALGFHLQAATSAALEGGARAALELRDLVYRTGDTADPLFKLSSLALRVGRADPQQRVFRIDEVSVAGLEGTARRDVDGNVHVLGLTFGAASTPSNAGSASARPSVGPAVTPAIPSAVTPPTGASAAAAMVAPATLQPTPEFTPPNDPWQVRTTPPTVRLEKFDIGIEKLTFIDETHAAGALPLVGSMHIASAGPSALLDSNPGDLPPLHLDLRASIEPIVKDVDVSIDVSPFADEPMLTATVAAHGIRGQGLTELAPELAARIDGSGLTEGDVAGKVQVQLSMERRSPTSFDFRRSFGVSVVLEGLAFRDRPGGTILAGLDSLSLVADRIVPTTGDIHVDSIDLIKPRAVFHKETDGMHLLGLVVKPSTPAPALPADATQATAPTSGAPATTPPAAPATVTASETSPANSDSAAPATSRGHFEVRVDELSISGVDLDIRDDSVTPPLVLPLVDLELNVYRFSTRAFEEPIPVRFSAFIAAGDVALPKRSQAGGSLTRMFTDLPGVSTVKDLVDPSRGAGLESLQPAFDELSASGVVSFSPRITGRVVTDLRSMQLLNFAGLAENAKIKINDGVLDARVKVEIDPDRGASVDARFCFSELSLSEPMGGPIQKYLLLPAPLDQVLFVLRDANGDQVVPLSFDVQGTDISTGQITKAAVTTFSELVAKAIANAPLRVLTWVGSWFGIGTGERDELAKQQRSFRFEPGDAALSEPAVQEIGKLIDLLNSDTDTMLVVRQELGQGDIDRAEVLANPTAEQCLEIVARLRQERARLLRQSDQVESQASALWSVGREDLASATSDRLRSVGRHLGETEETLDRMLDLLRPGAERYRDRRTHAACRVIGAQRIASLRTLLEARGVKDVDARLDLRALRPEPTAGQGGGRITLVPRLRSGP